MVQARPDGASSLEFARIFDAPIPEEAPEPAESQDTPEEEQEQEAAVPSIPTLPADALAVAKSPPGGDSPVVSGDAAAEFHPADAAGRGTESKRAEFAAAAQGRDSRPMSDYPAAPPFAADLQSEGEAEGRSWPSPPDHPDHAARAGPEARPFAGALAGSVPEADGRGEGVSLQRPSMVMRSRPIGALLDPAPAAPGLSDPPAPDPPAPDSLGAERATVHLHLVGPRAGPAAGAVHTGNGGAAADPARILAQISERLHPLQAGTVEVVLVPEELGRVRMVISVGENPAVTVHAEHQDTFDLLKRNADLLARELRNAGLADADIAFADGRGQRRPQARDAAADLRPSAGGGEPEIAFPPVAGRGEARLAAGRIDIRI